MVLFAGKSVRSMPERFVCIPWCEKALYKYSSFPFFPFLSVIRAMTVGTLLHWHNVEGSGRRANKTAHLFPKAPFTRYNLLLNRLSNRFNNRVNVCIHDITGCQTGCQTGLYNRFDKRLYRVNGV